jgi:hypothetical protein
MKKGYWIVLIVLTVLTLLSLAVNGVVVLGLLRAQQIALATVADARAVVAGLGDEAFSYTFEVQQEIPVATSVPFHEEITVPVETTIPIDTTVVVPIDLGITTYNLEVPIRTLVPVDLTFTVPISQTVEVSTTVPLELDVPIEIPLADTPFVGYLARLDEVLARLGEKLAHPLGGGEE